MRLLTVAAVFSLALPALAHDLAEIRAYEADWSERVVANGGVNIGLVSEYQDFVSRHSWYFSPSPPTQKPMNTRGASKPGSAPTSTTGGDWRLSAEPWRPLLAAYFGSEADRAVCVAGWESRGDAGAVSPTNDFGLMQIHYPIWGPHFGVSKSQLLDPELNVRLAKIIRDSQGWRMWSAVKRGKC